MCEAEKEAVKPSITQLILLSGELLKEALSLARLEGTGNGGTAARSTHDASASVLQVAKELESKCREHNESVKDAAEDATSSSTSDHHDSTAAPSAATLQLDLTGLQQAVESIQSEVQYRKTIATKKTVVDGCEAPTAVVGASRLRRCTIDAAEDIALQALETTIDRIKKHARNVFSSQQHTQQLAQQVQLDSTNPRSDDNVTHDESDEGADLRCPIESNQAITAGFSLQHLSAGDIASSPLTIWEWFTDTLPSLASRYCEGIAYGSHDLCHALLKCVTVMQHHVTAARTSAQPLPPSLVHITKNVIIELGNNAFQEETLRCVGEAFVAIFLYTVNLDGHFVAVGEAESPADVEVVLDVLQRSVWPYQLGTSTKSDLSAHDKVRQVNMKDKNKPIRPMNTRAFGWNIAHWAVMNWCLRVRADPAPPPAVRKASNRGTRAFSVWIERLTWSLNLLPSETTSVYRGIKGRTTKPYVQGTEIAWPAFSSTSTKDEEALKFMGKARGTFFMVHVRTAKDISFASWFPQQAELLVPPQRLFRVLSRVSDTVLTMLDSNVELISMQEQDEEVSSNRATISPDLQATNAINAASKTTFVYNKFIAKYVEGRFTRISGSEKPEHVVPVSQLAAELIPTTYELGDRAVAAAGPKATLVIGDSGSGKTSAMLYLLSHLATKGTDLVLPVFISLHALQFRKDPGGNVDESGITNANLAPLDKHLCASLGLQQNGEEGLKALTAKRRLVLFLDSLDEVPQAKRELLRDALHHNPLVKQYVSHVVLSTRSEAMHDGRALLNPVHQTLHCLPFTTQDTHTMLLRTVRSHFDELQTKQQPREEQEASVVKTLWARLEAWRVLPTLTNPFLSSMCIETLVQNPALLDDVHATTCDPSWQPLRSTTVYEAFLRLKLGNNATIASSTSFFPRIAVVTTVAASMTRAGASHTTVREVGSLIDEVSSVLRYESLEPHSTVSFRHKSVQEFLVARRVVEELVGGKYSQLATERSSMSLLSSLPYLAKQFPDVITLISHYLQQNDTMFPLAICSLRDIAVHASAPHAAATALSILSRMGVPFRAVFSNVSSGCIQKNNTSMLEGCHFIGGDLEASDFSGLSLRNTTFEDCKMRSTKFQSCNVTGCKMQSCDFEEFPACRGHTDAVCSVAFSPCSKYICSGGYDASVRLFAATTAKQLSVVADLGDMICSLAFSPNVECVCAGSDGGSIKVFSVCNSVLSQTATLEAVHGGSSVYTVAFSPCGTYLCSGGGDSTIRVFTVHFDNTATAVLKPAKTINGAHTADIMSVCFSPDGSLLCSGGDDALVKVFRVPKVDTDVWEPLHSFTGNETRIAAVAVSPDNKFCCSGGSDEAVKVFSIDTGEMLSSLQLGERVGAVSFHTFRNGTDVVVCSASDDGAITLSSPVTGQALSRFSGGNSGVLSLAFSPDESLMCFAGYDYVVKIFSTSMLGSASAARAYSGHRDTVSAVAISPTGRILCSAGYDNVIRVFSTTTGFELGSHSYKAIQSLAIVPTNKDNAGDEGRLLAAGDDRGSITLLSLSSGMPLYKIQALYDTVTTVAFSPDGSLLCAAGDDGRVKVFSSDNGEERFGLFKHNGSVGGVTFSPDAKHICSASNDAVIKLFCAKTGDEVQTCTAPHGISAVAYSADGQQIGCGGEEGPVQVVSADKSTFENEDTVRVLEHHEHRVCGIGFSNSGEYLCTASRDNTIRFFSTAAATTGAPLLLTMTAVHGETIECMTTSSSHGLICTGSSDKCINIFSMPTLNAMTEAREEKAIDANTLRLLHIQARRDGVVGGATGELHPHTSGDVASLLFQ